MKRWFSHDPGLDGLVLHDTKEEAEAAAQEYLDANQEIAGSDGWPEETGQICWGQILGGVDLVSSEPDPSGRFDSIDVYSLETYKPEPQPLDKEALLRAVSLDDSRLSRPPFGIGEAVIGDWPDGQIAPNGFPSLCRQKGVVINHCRDTVGEKVMVRFDDGMVTGFVPAELFRKVTEEDR